MTVIYVRNPLPTPAIQTGFTPYELWQGRKHIYEHLRVWSCVANAPEIQPWEDQLAWGDEFDEEEAPGEKAPERRVREEEQEQVFDWGDAEEVLASFHLRKPQGESSSAGQSSNGGDGDGDDDNDVDWEEMPFVTTRKKRRKLDTPGMLRGLRADTNSSYWESQKGKLPTTKGMGRTHSKSGSGTSNTGTSEAMVEAIYMVEAGPNTYKSLSSQMKGANARRLSPLSVHLWRRLRS